MQSNKIINFSIIAHIDHGKSTLAKCILQISGIKSKKTSIDSMELEEERGITIKSKTLRFYYGVEQVQMNMIDTPGHSDFSYEVSKALYACDFTLLLVDAIKGVQAQTYSNAYKAINQDVHVIPVINKIDMDGARVGFVEEELVSKFGFSKEEIYKVSAKTGEGVKELLDSLINIHSKKSFKKTNLDETKALIFDSSYDEYQGVIANILVSGDGFSLNDNVYLNHMNTSFEIKELGFYGPEKVKVKKHTNKEVGYVVTGLKDLSLVKVGDTIFKRGEVGRPYPGFEEVKPLVYLGVYCRDSSKTEELRKALNILNLSDSSFTYNPSNVGDVGFGFSCGFLGLLHADIILERLKREYDLDLVVTNPSVSYLIKPNGGQEYEIKSASEISDTSNIEYIKEPFVKVSIISPDVYTGKVIELVTGKRGEVKKMDYSGTGEEKSVLFEVKMPLSELIVDFNDKLKSQTSGMGSFDYEITGYEISDIVKLDIYIANSYFAPLSSLVHSTVAEQLARSTVLKLKNELPREQFDIALQAKIGGKIIARETIKSFRKDVTAKLYGGDRTRKDKLLKKQKLGKKRMKSEGRVDVSKETFLKIIRNYG